MPAKSGSARNYTLQHFRKGILAKDRIVLSQAITLAESAHAKDRAKAEALIEEILPKTGKSIRIGITGAPGVGKSTFIEAFGTYITSLGMTVAVLTIDPSSPKTKGSILGDKTRMEALSKHPMAYIRPSAAGTAPGGVANATRESVLLCEAAGFEVIVVETVGVGQSEVSVRGMVDFFLLLMLAGAGDELQGIKKGIMEMADGILITKADGDNIARAKQALGELKSVLHLFQAPESGWLPKVLLTSSLSSSGIKETWEMISLFQKHTAQNGFFKNQRIHQQLSWFHTAVDALLNKKILSHSKDKMASIEKRILALKISPPQGAKEILKKIKF